MMEERESKEYATNREVEIKKVCIKQNKDGTVARLVMETNKGWTITYNPSKYLTETGSYKGVETSTNKKASIPKEEIPEKFFKIGEVIEVNGVCKVRVSYHIWTREVDGQSETYRYLMKPQFEELKILNPVETVKEEVVE